MTGIWLVPVDGSAPRELTYFTTPGVESMPEWSPDSNKAFFHRRTARSNRAIFLTLADAGSAEPRYLTHDIAMKFDGALWNPETIQHASKDGQQIAALSYLPEITSLACAISGKKCF